MILREMLVDDLDQVMEIEQDLFHVPWTKEGFFTFLTRDDAMFLVVEEKEKILGYCGLLMVLDEGDITNVAVRRDRQKEGIVSDIQGTARIVNYTGLVRGETQIGRASCRERW